MLRVSWAQQKIELSILFHPQVVATIVKLSHFQTSRIWTRRTSLVFIPDYWGSGLAMQKIAGDYSQTPESLCMWLVRMSSVVLPEITNNIIIPKGACSHSGYSWHQEQVQGNLLSERIQLHVCIIDQSTIMTQWWSCDLNMEAVPECILWAPPPDLANLVVWLSLQYMVLVIYSSWTAAT